LKAVTTRIVVKESVNFRVIKLFSKMIPHELVFYGDRFI